MKLNELKKAKPATRKSSGTDDPSKYVGGWEEYTEPQGIGDRQDRKVLAKESEGGDPRDFLLQVSPTVRKAEAQINEVEPASLGATVAFISIMAGGHELSTIGPLDFSGAREMEKQIEMDIQRGYREYHPYGWTDNSGTVYMFDDWEVNIETCHSSECSEIISARMAAAQERKERMGSGPVREADSFGPAGLTRFAPDPDVPGYDVGHEEEKAIKDSRKAPKKTVRASTKALSARGKPPKLNPYKLDETIRRPFLGTLNAEYEVVDNNECPVGFARVTEGIIEVLDYLTEATEEFRGHIMSALLHQIVQEADRNRANLSMQADEMNGEIKYVLERFGFRRTQAGIFKRGHGAIRPASVPAPQGL